MGKGETDGSGGLGEAAAAAACKDATQSCEEEGDKPDLLFGGGNTGGNGLKVEEGTAAVGAGKLLGGRAPALGSLTAAGCGSPPLRAPRIG